MGYFNTRKDPPQNSHSDELISIEGMHHNRFKYYFEDEIVHH